VWVASVGRAGKGAVGGAWGKAASPGAS
jgi:hypothetical protein